MLVGCSAVAKVHAEAAVGGGCNVCTLTVVVVVGIFCCFVANYCRASAIFRITSLHYATSVGCIVSSALRVACRHLSCTYIHMYINFRKLLSFWRLFSASFIANSYYCVRFFCFQWYSFLIFFLLTIGCWFSNLFVLQFMLFLIYYAIILTFFVCTT